MTRPLRAVALFAATALIAPMTKGAVPGSNDQLKLFPETYGRFAPKGNCTRLPWATVSAVAIRIETAAGAASFTHPNVVTNFMEPQDESISYQLQCPGDGLQIVINGKTLWTDGGDHLGAAERALDAVADPNHTPLQRCKRSRSAEWRRANRPRF
ncbi:hypothetical protein [Flavisphingomonas formosensis]|uniref:hypothetical protein n=1 Tax=Flavisphingomonas formosensis TaxID=861534 RepID=UPI0012FC0CDB|nr:hypothetical protein [Sphingomonas formosensis]